jgi:hypothetical protein
MKHASHSIPRLCAALLFSLVAVGASAQKPQVYVNQNIGFNVEGFSYAQSEFPCEIDKTLVTSLIEQGNSRGLNMEAVGTADKILNGVIPVLAIDVEQLVLNEKYKYGTRTKSNLPMVKVTAALITSPEKFVSAKHSCAIATLNEFTPSSNILDMGTVSTVCSATRKCLNDLSKDIVQWIEPQLK